MAAAAATAVALKTVPPTVSLANGGGPGTAGLSAAHLAAMAAAVAPIAAPTTPAKRPALADAKSGLPMFDYGQQGLYTLPTQAHLAGNKSIQPTTQVSQHPQPKMSPPASNTSASASGGVVSQENGVVGQENGTTGEAEQKPQATAVGQFYPETCESFPCFLHKTTQYSSFNNSCSTGKPTFI